MNAVIPTTYPLAQRPHQAIDFCSGFRSIDAVLRLSGFLEALRLLPRVLVAASWIAAAACGQREVSPPPPPMLHALDAKPGGIALAPAPFPILFVVQVPVSQDDASRLSAFANHLTSPAQVPRGGDLMLRYPDGHLRNLTREAGFGQDGVQGTRAIAVREPSMHWSGAKAVFSMLVGTPTKQEPKLRSVWQLYEVTGLARGQTAAVTKVPFQPPNFSHVSPIYTADDQLVFTSERPRFGLRHLHPQLDEYEATPSVTGLWRLNPATGAMVLLTHTPSGAFGPLLDSFGRIVFTRWDHLQQDRLAERDRNAMGNRVALPFQSFNFVSEHDAFRKTPSRQEWFPESLAGAESAFGPVSAFLSNFFTVWQINPDGTGEETLNHVGQHELAFGFLTPSFKSDGALTNHTQDGLHANQVPVRREGGLFHLREDPMEAGSFYAVSARESHSFTTDRLVKLTGAPQVNPELMQLREVTHGDASDWLRGGRFRNPLPLSDGRLVASHTTSTRPPEPGTPLDNLRLTWLVNDKQTAKQVAGPRLTAGVRKRLAWWQGGKLVDFDGELWELEAVEVRVRARPVPVAVQLPQPERDAFVSEGVDEAHLRQWMIRNNLALIVTRDQTSRDRAERQQPFNLRVPGGVQTLASDAPGSRIYDISQFQIFQGDQVRAYPGREGRRVIARPMSLPEKLDLNRTAQSAAALRGSVPIFPDGSTAAWVPARQALTWQSADSAGNAVVRERNWITFQPGEIRVCASCHGVNRLDQAGRPAPTHQPLALRDLLRRWKLMERSAELP